MIDVLARGMAANTIEMIEQANERIDTIEQEIAPIAASDVTITEASGVFDDEAFENLRKSTLSQIIYNNCYYKLAYKDNTTRRYITDILYQGNIQIINVTIATKAYQYSVISDPALEQHINNTNVHIQDGERDRWNNKVSCSRSNEILIFSIN